ncbi:MAG: phosphotriesterase family protein [Geminicoccaceae bacterium]
MTAYAQSVTGRVSAAALGSTLMHEHVLSDLRDPKTRDDYVAWPEITWENRFQIDYFSNSHQPNMLLDDDAVAARELALYREAGGGTIVELTVGGLRPQPERLRVLSKASGVNVVLGAGFYVDSYLPETIRNADVDELEMLILSQLREGAWGTDIRAGLIGEIGCSWPLLPSERRMLIASARAQAKTGAAITIHPGRHPDAPAEIGDVLTDAGADPSRTVIGHMDRTIFDVERLIALLDRGFVLEWDFFGIETSQYWMKGIDLDLPTDKMRLDLINSLMAKGYGKQIAISHDICTRTRLCSYGGHGYRHLLINIVPMLLRHGWQDEEIEQLLIETPARLLCYITEGDQG